MPSPTTPPSVIAYVDHATDIGGAEKSLLDIVGRLDRSRYAPRLFCATEAKWLQGPGVPEVEAERVFTPGGFLERRREDVRPGLLGQMREALPAAGPVWRLWRRFRSLRPALVHTNTLKTHLVAGAAAHLARRPLIWHLRDILEPGNALALLLRAARRFRPRIIAISEAVRASLGEADAEVTVIHNGTNLSAFQPAPDRPALRDRLGLRPDEVAVSIVGRLTPWKGHRELLRAFAEVAREQPNVRLLVVGEVAFWEDAYDAELKALADALGISSRVNWLGFRDDVPAVLAASDVFALPSVDEPFGRAIVEAMACEQPVVATRSGGVPEIVVQGETGLLVPPGEHRELAAALLTLVRDVDLRQRMGRAGRARAMTLFDVHRTAQRVQDLYQEMLAGLQESCF
jgi:glycosyltransferase involved in cell wall biosynthesis